MNNTLIFISFSGFAVLTSFLLDRQKTVQGIKKGLKMLKDIILPFINILILVSVLLFLIPPEFIAKYLGAESGFTGFSIASILGSITLIPGIISYPIAAGFLQRGASYATVAVFMTTLMMVGVVTLPLEIKYFGKKAAFLRNILSFLAALLIGFLVGVIFNFIS